MKSWIVVIVSLLFASSHAVAHEVSKGPNGGRVVEAGAYHVELVVNANAVNVFVTDSVDKPVAVTGFKGVAILTVSGKAQRIVLEAKDAVHLTGTSPVTLPPAPAGVVQVTGPDGKTAQGRYH
jgi:hypothetical protein